ncbi:hypothetical protein [Rhizobium wenxiniae]|uniref:hypothetical protein n=1 Tax=Rhizobium wenxiniae TaxID=1737357 RepID=UPI003C15CFAD
MVDFFSTTQGFMTLGALIGAGSFALGAAGGSMSKIPGLFRPRDKKSNARNLAMLTVLALDDYVGACYAAVHDKPEFNPADQVEFAFHLPEPVLNLPKDVEWRSLGDDLGEEILWFSNRVRNHENALESLDLARKDHDSFFERRVEGYARLAARAMDLIARVCNEFDLTLPDKPDYYHQAEGLAKILHALERANAGTAPLTATVGTTNVTPLFPKIL